MKCFSKIFFVFALTPLLGCNQGTTGGPGVGDPKANKSVLGRADDTFNLSAPLMLTSVQQGTQTEGIIGINRAKNFDGDVTLEFKNVPAGMTIQPEHPTIKHGDRDSKVSFVVDDSAAKGEFKIEVLGHPKQGADAKIEFRIAVSGRDSFSLNMPLLSTSLKQDESELVSIKVNRDKTFSEDITLRLIDLPVGVTTEPTSIVNRNGEGKSEFKLVAAKDAALGRFAVKMNGHPTSGDESSKDFNFVVSKDE